MYLASRCEPQAGFSSPDRVPVGEPDTDRSPFGRHAAMPYCCWTTAARSGAGANKGFQVLQQRAAKDEEGWPRYYAHVDRVFVCVCCVSQC